MGSEGAARDCCNGMVRTGETSTALLAGTAPIRRDCGDGRRHHRPFEAAWLERAGRWR
jgi:hypothetical protein